MICRYLGYTIQLNSGEITPDGCPASVRTQLERSREHIMRIERELQARVARGEPVDTSGT